MFTRFTDIFNGPKTLDRDIVNVLVNKIHHPLLCSWEPKVMAILEAKDLTTLDLDQLIGSLITHEMINSNDEEENRSYTRSFSFG